MRTFSALTCLLIFRKLWINTLQGKFLLLEALIHSNQSEPKENLAGNRNYHILVFKHQLLQS
jgi:hypothetical protein